MTTEDIIEGSLPLGDVRHEAFAQAVARGADKVAAFRDSHDDADDGIAEGSSSIRSRSHRLAKRVAVAARILFLKAERDAAASESLPQRWDTRALGIVAREATEALTAAFRACEADPSVPESARSAIRREAVRHAGRVHRAGATKQDRADLPASGETSKMLAQAVTNLRLCTCEETASDHRQ